MTKLFRTCLLILTLAVVAVGCSRKKDIEQTTYKSGHDSPKKRLEDSFNARPLINTFESRMAITLSDGKKEMPLKGSIKIDRDKHIQISIQPFLGIEIVRADFTQDSVCIIDRFNRRYLAVDFETYSENMPADVGFNAIQALFLNEMFDVSDPKFTLKDAKGFKWRSEPNGDMVGRNVVNSSLTQDFFLNPNNSLIETLTTYNQGAHVLSWEYSDFKPMDNGLFPNRSVVNYSTSGTKMKMELVYSRIDRNKPMKLSISIPRSYKKIEPEELIKAISNL